MSQQTIRPTSMKPSTLPIESMSPLVTIADVQNALSSVVSITPQTVADSTASDIASMVSDHNALLSALRSAGVLTV